MTRITVNQPFTGKQQFSKPDNPFHLSMTPKPLMFCILAFYLLCLTWSCKKDLTAGSDMNLMDNHRNVIDGFLNKDEDLLPKTVEELKLARAASARYQNIGNAVADGYVDIQVVLPNMGFHYMKAAYLDNQFQIDKPEILVYNKKDNGQIELVAVEYAVPIPLMPNQAPEGFTGNSDVWSYNTGFNLWLLHAWVWKNNPDGVFHATNPLVHVD